jgi:hypothetical protein
MDSIGAINLMGWNTDLDNRPLSPEDIPPSPEIGNLNALSTDQPTAEIGVRLTLLSIFILSNLHSFTDFFKSLSRCLSASIIFFT